MAGVLRLDVGQLFRATMGGPSESVQVTDTGRPVTFDVEGLAGALASAQAAAMAANMERGIRPDGSGSMPGRRRDGRPRGLGAAVLRSIEARRTGTLEYLIRAWREQKPGQLARILREVPFTPPPLARMPAAVDAALASNIRSGR